MGQGNKAVWVDAHQHFWKYNAVDYGWIDNTMSTLRRDFLPQDLQNEINKNAIDFIVAVQARQTLGETEWLLNLAEQNPFIKAVVGWVDLKANALEETLQDLCRNPKFKGVRHVLQDEPDPQYMLQDGFLNGIHKLEQFGLAYDILIFPRHIKYAVDFVSMCPNQMFVIDHLAKPFISKRQIDPWRSDMAQLAQAENVYCKISGLVTEGSWNNWKAQDFAPYMEAVVELFGPRRLMFGSDWPVCTLVATYEQVLHIVSDFIQSLSPAEQSAIMGLTASEFYKLKF